MHSRVSLGQSFSNNLDFHSSFSIQTFFLIQVYSKLQSELKTLALDTFNPDRLIWISNVNTFDFLLNPLFFFLFLSLPVSE